jgi:hypothetical protein
MRIGFKSAAVFSMVWTTSWVLPAGLGLAQQDVPALVAQARENFKPVSSEQVAAARAELQKRISELERFVGPSTTNGQRWLKYLKLSDLKQSLAAEAPAKFEAVDATYDRLNRDENGLELPKFRALADALRRYRYTLAVSQWENPADIYAQQLDALAKALDQYRQEPTAANEVALANQLVVVDNIGQAPALAAAVRKEFGRPNAFIDVSGELLKAAAEPINRSERITDIILGTNIHGNAHTTGKVEIQPVPSDKAGVLQLTSKGHSVSQNVGRNGPAVIRSTAHTDFTATKRVELSDHAFTSSPARADATTNTDIHSISKSGGGIGSRMVSRIGWQRANQSEGQAEAIAADHAEDRIERQFNNEVHEKLADARKRYEDEYRRPLARRGEVPDHIQFGSTKDALTLELTQAGRGQLAATVDPPAQPAGHDVTMRLHESAVNNYSGITLSGATVSQAEAGQESKFDVKMPKWMEDAWKKRKTDRDATAAAATDGFKPWSLRFRQGRPISVDFEDGKMKLTLHIARLESGSSDPFTRWDVWGIFVPELQDGGVVLRREGELDALPTGFRGNLSSLQAAQRNNLIKEFNSRSAQGEGFPNTIEFGQFEPEGALKNAGPLQLTHVTSENGWLTLVWDRAQKPNAPQQARRSDGKVGL